MEKRRRSRISKQKCDQHPSYFYFYSRLAESRGLDWVGEVTSDHTPHDVCLVNDHAKTNQALLVMAEACCVDQKTDVAQYAQGPADTQEW